MLETHKADVLVAGQGAAAFAAALYSARYQLDTIIASESFGGETAIGGLIENYPGTPDIDGFDLMLKFKEQVDKLEVPTISRNLEAVEPSDGTLHLHPRRRRHRRRRFCHPLRRTRTPHPWPAQRGGMDRKRRLLLLHLRRTPISQQRSRGSSWWRQRCNGRRNPTRPIRKTRLPHIPRRRTLATRAHPAQSPLPDPQRPRPAEHNRHRTHRNRSRRVDLHPNLTPDG